MPAAEYNRAANARRLITKMTSDPLAEERTHEFILIPQIIHMSNLHKTRKCLLNR